MAQQKSVGCAFLKRLEPENGDFQQKSPLQIVQSSGRLPPPEN